MFSFFKSIFGTITSANSTERKICPDYFNAMHVNNNVRSNVVKGLNVTVNTDVSRVFGTRPTTTFLTNRLNLDPFHSSSSQFGMSYANKTQAENSADREATVHASANTDLNGRVVGQARCCVTDHVTLDVCGERDDRTGVDKSHEMNASANWSGGRFNASAGLSVRTAAGKPWTAFVAEGVRQLGDRWTIGGNVVADDAGVQCSGALRHDGGCDTFVAEANRAADVSLRYRRRVDDKWTVGAEATVDVRAHAAKVTLMQRARLGDGIELRGQIDTDGLIVGHVRKAFPQNTFNMGACASFNYKTGQTTLGAELTVG